ncbi:hypothetical protein [Rhodococcus ruber]|uniref:hypothetical protein n=1 Tax=Rhodococcus ruber TaxID=1830 RepID=UPI0006604533|nr:hypothetical protein [Rhodococcus ruber]MCF8786756.1 hypothetical protein [Rhodococcus ruber]WKK14957.1 hypothetical protein QYN14_27605 [Rhodococcus ruber]
MNELNLLGASKHYEATAKLMEVAMPKLLEYAHVLNECFREWELTFRLHPTSVSPKARYRDENDLRGHKLVLQLGEAVGLAAALDRRLPRDIHDLLLRAEAMGLEARVIFQNLLGALPPGMYITTRLITYMPGRHPAQRLHLDSGVATLIHRPAHDDRLVIDGHNEAPSLDHPSVLAITGEDCHKISKGLTPTWHSVKPLTQLRPRHVITHFLWDGHADEGATSIAMHAA